LPTTSLTQALPARLPGLASLLLVIAIGIVLARLTWQLLPGEAPVSPHELTPQQDAKPKATPRSRDGLAVALFGMEQAAPELVAEPVPEEAPPTRLDLKLRGIALANGEQPSLAIVEGSDRESLPYRVGDTLPGDAELLRIEADRVILRHRGSVEALYFSDEPPPAAARTRSTTRLGSSGGTSGSVQLSPQSSSRIRDYLSLLPSDPTRMTELVRALPVMENGQLKGFRLFPGQQRELFGEAGLRRGDIATSINGLPLDDPARGMELLNQLASASRFKIEILRRGQPQVLDIQL
jgi:general secretion pathway protein C